MLPTILIPILVFLQMDIDNRELREDYGKSALN